MVTQNLNNFLVQKYKNIPLSNFRLGSLSKKYISEFIKIENKKIRSNRNS